MKLVVIMSMLNNIYKRVQFSYENVLKFISIILIAFLVSSCNSNSNSINGEYVNESTSVKFDPEDKSVIIKVKTFLGLTTVHGNYKFKENNLYLFDKSGNSYGAFTLLDDDFIADRDSKIKSLTPKISTKSLPKLTKLEALSLGEWTGLEGGKLHSVLFLRNQNVALYIKNQPKAIIGTWKKDMIFGEMITLNINIPPNNDMKDKVHASIGFSKDFSAGIMTMSDPYGAVETIQSAKRTMPNN